jgi:hypothetical protein
MHHPVVLNFKVPTKELWARKVSQSFLQLWLTSLDWGHVLLQYNVIVPDLILDRSESGFLISDLRDHYMHYRETGKKNG